MSVLTTVRPGTTPPSGGWTFRPNDPAGCRQALVGLIDDMRAKGQLGGWHADALKELVALYEAALTVQVGQVIVKQMAPLLEAVRRSRDPGILRAVAVFEGKDPATVAPPVRKNKGPRPQPRPGIPALPDSYYRQAGYRVR